MRKPYPSDLTDAQWAIIEPLIPVHDDGAAPDQRHAGGAQRHLLPQPLRLPVGHAPPRPARQEHRLQPLRPVAGRRHLAADHGRPPAGGPGGRRPGAQPERRRASTARRSRGPRSGASGATTGARRSPGWKRHIVVDTLGLLLVVVVSAASADDGTFAPEVLGRLTAEHRSRLEGSGPTGSTTTITSTGGW